MQVRGRDDVVPIEHRAGSMSGDFHRHPLGHTAVDQVPHRCAAEAVRATIPFIIMMMIDLAIMAVFPIVPLMLPHLIFGYPLPRLSAPGVRPAGRRRGASPGDFLATFQAAHGASDREPSA